jgi:glycosyltransferase involved in cell wall biosynthesis
VSRLRRVGLNLLFLVPGETGGPEVYARNLIPRLAEIRPDLELIAFVNREGADLELDGAELVKVDIGDCRKARHLFADQRLFPKLTREHRIDLLHSLGTWAPIRSRAVSVVTLHDVIYAQIPETHPRANRMRRRVLVPAVARSAARVITPSAAAAADICELLSLPRDRIDVIPMAGRQRGPATPESELRERFALGDALIVLCVSPRRPHKNTARLFAALARLKGDPAPILVMPGYPTRFGPALDEEAARLGITDRIRCPGWVSDEDLEGLYQMATCFVFPSLAEGFGIPVVEAMERGLPVACSRAPSLPEVAGNAARYFDPLREADIAAAIVELMGDTRLREELAAAGRERVRRFSWERTARLTAESYERAWGEAAPRAVRPAAVRVEA